MAVRVPKELVERDPAVLAPAAGLIFVPDTEPGIARVQVGNGFEYTDAFGTAASPEQVERIETLAIPPAWRDVWIASEPRSYLQAAGVDDAGRKQYRYHDDFRNFCDRRKFARLTYFARGLVLVRKAVARHLESPAGTRERAVAAAVRLIDSELLRVGNHESASNGHYGATTLRVEHFVDDGEVTLEYTGKSGTERQIIVEDDDLADVLTALADDADDELFWFEDPKSRERRRATADDINRFIGQHAGPAFSAKDFRTWGGSRAALEARIHGADGVAAADAAANDLGNTRAVARSSYIHPAVLDTPVDQLDSVWQRSRSSSWYDRPESALAKLLTAEGSG